MGKVALDSSVVIGFLRPVDAHHHSARAELASARLRQEEFVLPASVLSEAMVGGYRAGTADVMRERIVGLFGPVRPVDEDVAVVAAQLRARHRALRLPDALVIATGVVDDAVVLTCDRGLHDVDPRVQVVGDG